MYKSIQTFNNNIHSTLRAIRNLKVDKKIIYDGIKGAKEKIITKISLEIRERTSSDSGIHNTTVQT